MVCGALLADCCVPTSQSVVSHSRRAINIMTKAPAPFAAARLEGGRVFSVAGAQYFAPPSKPVSVPAMYPVPSPHERLTRGLRMLLYGSPGPMTLALSVF